MKHFLKIGAGAPAQAIMGQIEDNPLLWDQNTIRKTAPGTPHSRMSDIWVRYNDVTPFKATGDYRTFNDRHVPIWYPAWGSLLALRKPVFDLMAAVQGEMLGGILITRIPPGGKIDPHVDRGWHVDYYDKFYLALQNDPGATFFCQGPDDDAAEGLTPEAGEIWRFDNRMPHWVENNSERDRITAIICIRTNLFQQHRAQ